jgi:hypothetical protein
MLDSNQTKGNEMSKALKVVSINLYGEDQEVLHGIGDVIPETAYTVAILQGVIKAGHAIKSFEVVEV